jgi:integration host factor subunit alpha
LNKSDLTDQIRKEHDLKHRQAASIVDLLFQTMKTELQKRKRVYIRNFGSFEVRKYKARIIKKNQYGTISTVETREKVRFKPSINILKNQK